MDNNDKVNFDSFADSFKGGLINNLNNTFKSDNEELYNKMVYDLKSMGIKVYRGEKGNHELVIH